jgi:hypothetical protein
MSDRELNRALRDILHDNEEFIKHAHNDNFTGDFNSIHAAEATLTLEQYPRFAAGVLSIADYSKTIEEKVIEHVTKDECDSDAGIRIIIAAAVLKATPRQRAEVLLTVLTHFGGRK